jgi:transposase
MIVLPSGARVWLACGYTDMRKGMDGLAMLAQQMLQASPFSGALFAFRGKRGGLIKPKFGSWTNCTANERERFATSGWVQAGRRRSGG